MNSGPKTQEVVNFHVTTVCFPSELLFHLGSENENHMPGGDMGRPCIFSPPPLVPAPRNGTGALGDSW